MIARGSVVEVIANTRVAGEGRELLAHPDAAADGLFDIWLAHGRIADIAPAGAIRRRGAVLDAEGSWLVPGLWDHHVHMLQWALASSRPSAERAGSPAEAAAIARTAPLQEDGRRVLSRWRDALWEEPVSLAALDAATGDVPTFLISSDVHAVWMNSAAFRDEGMHPTSDGVVREETAFALIDRLDDVSPAVADAAHARAAEQAAARGVVGIWDLEFGENHAPWRRRADAGWDRLRVFSNVYPDDIDQVIATGLRTGDPLARNPFVRLGMLKIIGDGALGARTAATSVDYAEHPPHRGRLNVAPRQMVELVSRAASAGIETTIHAIGDVASTAALDAFAVCGVPGRVEHAQLVAAADLSRFARLDVDASVQPQHLVDDRDVTDRFWAEQTAAAYPFRSLRDHGANLLFGSDGPVTDVDPWIQMAAAVFRSDDGRAGWRMDQALDRRTALAASTLGGSQDPQMIEPGALGDLVLVSDDPLAADRDALRAMEVRATLIAGRLTHLS